MHVEKRSPDNVREWFDEQQPDVRFEYTEGRLGAVVVRGCDGRDVRVTK